MDIVHLKEEKESENKGYELLSKMEKNLHDEVLKEYFGKLYKNHPIF